MWVQLIGSEEDDRVRIAGRTEKTDTKRNCVIGSETRTLNIH